MKDESRSLWAGRVSRRRKYVMAEPFTDHEDPDFVVEHERLGTIEAFREGLAELRAAESLRALEGRPVVRRRRTWVAACEIGSVELVLGHGKKGRFFLEQRGRYWLGKAWSCSPWVVDGDLRSVDLMKDESGKMKVAIPAAERIREVVREAALSSEGCEKRTGWFVVIVGTEVAEKRGRHWVRMPYCCGVRVASVVEQNSLDSQNSLDLLDLLDSQDCSRLSPSGGASRFDSDGDEVLRSCWWRSADSQETLLELEEIQDTDGEGKDVAADDLRLESELPVPIHSERVDLGCDGACSEYKVEQPGDWLHFEHEGLILDLRARLPAWENRPRFAVRNCHAIRAG